MRKIKGRVMQHKHTYKNQRPCAYYDVLNLTAEEYQYLKSLISYVYTDTVLSFSRPPHCGRVLNCSYFYHAVEIPYCASILASLRKKLHNNK